MRRRIAESAHRLTFLAANMGGPSSSLFGRIRLRLTLWYSGVLAAALVLSGVVLYLAVQQSLLGPVTNALKTEATQLSVIWQTDAAKGIPVEFACPWHEPLPPGWQMACYDAHANLLQINADFSSFGARALAQSALNGSAGDTVQTGQAGENAALERYALPVPDPSGRGIIGVLQVGFPVGSELSTLATLLHLLLVLGALTLLFSLAAGMFLANRALQPARIAYARQRDFIADASHELRTPLTMLRSSVEFVLRNRWHLSPDDIALLEDTVQETVHLTTLANNMLDLARLDSEDVHIEDDVVDMADLSDEVVRWAHPMASERQVLVTVEGSSSLLVLGDRTLLEQALLVLVDNGIKYNHSGGSVKVCLSTVDGTANMEVRDTGIGVAPEHLRRLGERFYRVDKARSRESGGAGLGLSIVRSIVMRHGGTFRIESEPDVGTRATVELPLVGIARRNPHLTETAVEGGSP